MNDYLVEDNKKIQDDIAEFLDPVNDPEKVAVFVNADLKLREQFREVNPGFPLLEDKGVRQGLKGASLYACGAPVARMGEMFTEEMIKFRMIREMVAGIAVAAREQGKGIYEIAEILELPIEIIEDLLA